MAKGDGRPPSPFVRCSVFVGLILRDGVQIRLYIFGFLGPLGLDSGRFTTPFLKCVSSNFSKKTNNPNPSPIKKIWFGLYLFGAGGGARTRTAVGPRDFKSLVSAIPPHRQRSYFNTKWKARQERKSARRDSTKVPLSGQNRTDGDRNFCRYFGGSAILKK